MTGSFVGISLTFVLLALGCGSLEPRSATPLPALAASGKASVQKASEQGRLTALDTDELTDSPLSEPAEDHESEGIFPGPPPDDLGNFGRLNDRLFRGARPTAKGIGLLKDRGITLIVNLENNRRVVNAEKELAEKNGLSFKSIPMGIFLPPKLSKVNEFLRIAADNSNVIYFHCMQGRDRTGTMAFCHRSKVDRWTTEKAYDEMKAFQFHTYLVGLRGFVFWFGKVYGPGSNGLGAANGGGRSVILLGS